MLQLKFKTWSVRFIGSWIIFKDEEIVYRRLYSVCVSKRDLYYSKTLVQKCEKVK